MSDAEHLEAFELALDALVTRFISEFSLSTAGAIGVIEMKSHELKEHARRCKFGEDEEHE